MKRKQYLKLIKKNNRKAQLYSNRLKRKQTKEELCLSNKLDQEGIFCLPQSYFFDSKRVFIVDLKLFLNDGSKLIIEVDGKNHKYQKEYDNDRTIWLTQKRNCKVLRFTNDEINNNLDLVISKIKEYNPKHFGNMEQEEPKVRKNNWFSNFLINKAKFEEEYHIHCDLSYTQEPHIKDGKGKFYLTLNLDKLTMKAIRLYRLIKVKTKYVPNEVK